MFALAEVSVRGVVLSLSVGDVVGTLVFCASVSCFCTVDFIFVCTVNGVDFTAVVVKCSVVLGVVVCISEHGM